MVRHLLGLIGALALAVGFIAVNGSVAGAHSTLARASPGPGDEVGGPVDQLDLVFVAGLSDATVTLTDPDGSLIDGTTSQSQNNRLRFATDKPLTVEGQYIVRYRFDSVDGDSTESAYAFSYRASAPAPKTIGPVDPAPEPDPVPGQTTKVSPIKYLGLGAMVLALIGVAALAWSYRPGRTD